MAEQTIDQLSIEISASASKAASNIQKLESSITKLRSATSGSVTNLTGMAKSITALQQSMSGVSLSANGAKSLVNTLTKLKELQNIELSGVSNSIRQFASSAKGLKDFGGMLNSVTEFNKSLTKLKNSFKKLDDMDYNNIAQKVERLASALKPLTQEMIKAGPYALAYAQSLQGLAQALRTANNAGTLTYKLTQNVQKMNNSFSNAFNTGKVTAFAYSIYRVGTTIGDFINETNEYIENMNLFSVSMGKAADKGEEFANKMQNLLGINAGDAMRNMGLFNNLVESFGATSEQAYILSKNLTQLGYDLSSFFNISAEDAFQKLQAGIAGEQTCLTQSRDCVVICLNRGTSKRLAA